MSNKTLTKKELENNTEFPEPASIEEACQLMQEVWDNIIAHGIIVGIVLRINVDFSQETTIITSDGFTFVSEIPMIGIDLEEKPEYRYNILCMKELVMMIPSLGKKVEGDYLTKRGTLQETYEARQLKHICYFIFRPIEDGIIDYSRCLGIWTLDNLIQFISNDPDSEYMPEVGAYET